MPLLTAAQVEVDKGRRAPQQSAVVLYGALQCAALLAVTARRAGAADGDAAAQD